MALNADKPSCMTEENYCISAPINNEPLNADGNMVRNLNVPDNILVFSYTLGPPWLAGIQLYTAEVGGLIINVCLFLTSPLSSYQGCNVSHSYRLSLAFNISQRSLGPTDWWIGLSIGQPGEEVRCVFHGAHSSFCTMASSSASAYFSRVFFCRWSDKTDLEFQNWAKVSGRTRKNGLCVTMSSSTGEDLQRHSRL